MARIHERTIIFPGTDQKNGNTYTLLKQQKQKQKGTKKTTQIFVVQKLTGFYYLFELKNNMNSIY